MYWTQLFYVNRNIQQSIANPNFADPSPAPHRNYTLASGLAIEAE
jgi:hypothetical protein